MTYNTTAYLDELTCTDYVDFGKYQDRFGRYSLSGNDSNYLDVKLNVFRKDDKKEFRLVQNLRNWRSRFQPIYAIEETTGQCSRKLCSRRKFDPSADTYNVQRHGWTTQTGSQGSWRIGPSKQKDLWLCCGTMWISLRVHMLKSDCLQGRRRTRSFNKLSMWIINLRSLSIY